VKTVSELAALARVSVRTLHHYDAIGLLSADRTDAGHRVYGDREVRRLHEIVFWRSLGFPLDEIRALLDDAGRDPLEAMRMHRDRLRAQLGELHENLAAVDAALARAQAAEPLSDADLVALFDGFDPAAYDAEVEERWGDSEEYRESRRRTARYGVAEWTAIKAEGAALNERLGALCRAGVPPDAPEAREAAAAHRAYTDRWFYRVSPEVHLGLGRMYVADPRFAATYEAVAPGLASWLCAAIEALHAPRRRAL
jgi:DNA-binding transcriptional MerR regulator